MEKDLKDFSQLLEEFRRLLLRNKALVAERVAVNESLEEMLRDLISQAKDIPTFEASLKVSIPQTLKAMIPNISQDLSDLVYKDLESKISQLHKKIHSSVILASEVRI